MKLAKNVYLGGLNCSKLKYVVDFPEFEMSKKLNYSNN